MMRSFKRIGLMGRKINRHIADTAFQIQTYLLKQNIEVVLESNIATLIPHHKKQLHSHTNLIQDCDLVIVIGGDGSMLSAARLLAGTDTLVLGVNRGQLGFLTDIASDNLDHHIQEVLAGQYWVEERFLLELHILKQNELIHTSSALNEVVLHSEQMTRMIEFELFVDQHFVMTQKSDGIIISTPTGSTAYALSAGGPIMHPSLNALALIPMYPHTLSNRPLVIGGDSEIKINIKNILPIASQISCDGHVHTPVSSQETVIIKKKEAALLLIHPTNYN